MAAKRLALVFSTCLAFAAACSSGGGTGGTTSHSHSSSTSASPRSLLVHGTVIVYDIEAVAYAQSSSCEPSGLIGGVKVGDQVVITNAQGATVAVSTLADGVVDTSAHSCNLGFDANIPEDSDFYGIQIAGKTIQVTYNQMISGPTLSIGTRH